MAQRKLYIIHVERPDQTIWHYIGVTTQPDASQRLAQHLRKSSTSAVKNYVNYASRVTMYELKKQVNIPMEKALQALDEQSVRTYVCPLCMKDATLIEGQEGFRFFSEQPIEVATVEPTKP
jgi:predicted GIY-YIG superfamily endonuclease